MSCESVTKALSLFLYGELSFEEEEAVHRHLDGCEDCRQALARERALHNALDETALHPPADLLAECRGDLRRNLGREPARRRNWLVRAWDWTGQPVSPSFLKPAGALALLMLGFFAGRLLQPAPGATPAQTVYVEDAATRRLLFDAAGAVNDPTLRLDSVAILGTRAGSPEISRMLVRTVRSDPNPVVRLKAIDGLKSYDIPAVLDSRPGVLGTAGLPMRSISDGHLETFKIMVPEESAEEAAGLVTMFLGGGEGRLDDELPDDDEEEG